MDELEGPNILAALWSHWFPAFPVPIVLLTAWLIMGFLIVMALLAVRHVALEPGRLQNALETALEYVMGLSRQIAGPEGARFVPLFATLFLFILCSNLIGLIPGFVSPTTNLNINAAMALIVAGTAEFVHIRQIGVAGYGKHFCGPPYWLAPMFIIIRGMEVFTRPLSLTMRLFGNMLAKEIMLGVLAYLLTLFFFSHGIIFKLLAIVPFLLRPGILLLGVLVGFVQALVFTALAMSYIGTAFAKH
ncbi:MAG: F0F1 ATP synthase subunit A [Kiritimatiellaeota bacterium]|nr:F0F1 ATP synthase subunit A [Kiritimatiellota bacterium]